MAASLAACGPLFNGHTDSPRALDPRPGAVFIGRSWDVCSEIGEVELGLFTRVMGGQRPPSTGGGG
jgi:hypothetical protein